MAEDTWFSRDRPVLDELVVRVERIDEAGFPTVGEVAESTGLSTRDVGRAVQALNDAGLIQLERMLSGGDPSPWFVTGVSAQARVFVGAWPSPEGLAERIVVVLEQTAESEPDPERKSRIRSLLGGAGETAKAALVEILSSAIAKSVTGG
jgi:hypothetical protein